MEFGNPIVNGIHATRYVASFENAGGKVTGIGRLDKPFMDWLRQLIINGRPLTEEEIDQIDDAAKMMRNGKFELQENAKKFLKAAE
jgi:hypothetical protein